ncbi:MFS transporter [Sciscionella marina]|uniref:MFS transporter n=1 Tax=Sciscionella marina TaxID=508770 RepID=UPI00036D6461|nr:MFS transporter [Sciscionella marina]
MRYRTGERTRGRPSIAGTGSRAALVGAWLGFFVDMFDVYLPIIALVPAAAYFDASDVSPATAAITSSLVFVAAFLGRPVGAFVFGHWADKVGRRKVALISIVGFGTTTLAIAALPGYRTWGVAALSLLIVLRFVDGVFLGGEYTGASVLALEASPPRRRGLHGASIMSGYPLAYCFAALVTFVVLHFAPAAGIDSPYVQWGWRIPFVIGCLLAFAVAVWYARHVTESETWIRAPKSSSPMRDLLRGPNLHSFLQVFVLMTGSWLAANILAAVVPKTLAGPAHLGPTAVTVVQIVAYAILALIYPAAGALSQRIGRRNFFFATATTTALPATVLVWLLTSGRITGLLAAIGIMTAVNILAFSTAAVTTTYLNERFPIGIRSSGFGMGFSAAIVLPSFYAFYQTVLATMMPAQYTPLVLLFLAGLLIGVGALLGPETRDTEIAATTPHHEPDLGETDRT